MVNIRKEMPDVQLTREQFRQRFRQRFDDPAFAPPQAEIDRLADVAWDAYDDYRKAPRTRRAGRASPIPTTSCRSSGSRPAQACRTPSGGRRTPPRPRASC